jgi:acetoacetyl-CoA synthetase
VTTHGDTLWTPTEDRVQQSRMHDFAAWISSCQGARFDDYRSLHKWSVDHLPEFWHSVWEYFDVLHSSAPESILEGNTMPHVQWFTGARLNYAENVLRQARRTPDEPAIISTHERLATTTLTWAQLEQQTASLARHLRNLDVGPGDHVAAVLPHLPQTVVALLAAASVGATWSVVNTDFGRDGVLDRFSQLEPTILFTVDAYEYNGTLRPMLPQATELAAGLPSVQHVIVVDQYPEGQAGALPAGYLRFSDLVADEVPAVYEQVPFDHPLWVLFSSGTTGRPKGIVHSHGGILLEALKSNGLHYDVSPGDRVYFAVSTTWAVWNMVVNTMVVGATIITYDGAPSLDGVSQHLAIASEHEVQMLGAGAAVLALAEKASGSLSGPKRVPSLRTIMVTGSPMPESTWRWVYRFFGGQVRLCSESGGTEVSTPFVGANPYQDVRLGESMDACLGVAAQSMSPDGERVFDEVGELVIASPMPSMPIRLVGDESGQRYRDNYFSEPGQGWHHGDWTTEFSDGGFVVHGRSDATINRGGIRMGSADITRVVDELDMVESSMVIGVELGDGQYYMPLFVVLQDGIELDDRLADIIRGVIRERVSPRYIPDEIIQAPNVPRTRTGKLIEIPVKRLFQGDSAKNLNTGSAEDPNVLAWYAERAASFRSSR